MRHTLYHTFTGENSQTVATMMSVDTCRSSSSSSLRSEAPKGSMVRPQPVTESSLLDSVAGFINEVQALNKPNHDSKIQITWASFQKADINDPGLCLVANNNISIVSSDKTRNV